MPMIRVICALAFAHNNVGPWPGSDSRTAVGGAPPTVRDARHVMFPEKDLRLLIGSENNTAAPLRG